MGISMDSGELKESFPTGLPPLGQSIIEDFLIEKINLGISHQEIINSFIQENIPDVITSYIDGIKTKVESVDWEESFSDVNINAVKDLIAGELETLNIPDDQIEMIRDTRITSSGEISTSFAGASLIMISKVQILRKTMDYLAVFPEAQIKDIQNALSIVIIGHELGHFIHNLPNIDIYNLPTEWDGEDKSERFAEYWGRVAAKTVPHGEEIRENDLQIQRTKIQDTKGAILKFNRGKDEQNQLDINSLYSSIAQIFASNPEVKAFLSTRIAYYDEHDIESYARPYDKSTIQKTVKQ